MQFIIYVITAQTTSGEKHKCRSKIASMNFCNTLSAFVLFFVNTRQEDIYISLSKRCTIENKEEHSTNYKKCVSAFMGTKMKSLCVSYMNKCEEEAKNQIKSSGQNAIWPCDKNEMLQLELIFEGFEKESLERIRKSYNEAYKIISRDKHAPKNDPDLKEFMDKLADVTWYAIMKYIEYIDNEEKNCKEAKDISYVNPMFKTKAISYMQSATFYYKLQNYIVKNRENLYKYNHECKGATGRWRIYKSISEYGYFNQLIAVFIKNLNMIMQFYELNYDPSEIIGAKDDGESLKNKTCKKSLLSDIQVGCIEGFDSNKATDMYKIYEHHVYQITQFTNYIKNKDDSNNGGLMQIFFEMSYYDSIFLIINEFFSFISKPANHDEFKCFKNGKKTWQKLFNFFICKKFTIFNKQDFGLEDIISQVKLEHADTVPATIGKIVIILGFDWEIDLNNYFEDLKERYTFCQFVLENKDTVVTFWRAAQQIFCNTIYDELTAPKYKDFECKLPIYFPYVANFSPHKATKDYDIRELDYEICKMEYNGPFNTLYYLLYPNVPCRAGDKHKKSINPLREKNFIQGPVKRVLFVCKHYTMREIQEMGEVIISHQ